MCTGSIIGVHQLMACAGCLFHGLKLETPSPVLLLDTGTAYFSDAVFSSIKGPPACGAMHVYAGAVALQDSGWSGTDASVEHDICLADVSSRVYADSSVGVTNLEGELGEDSGTLELEESAHHYPRFLRASDSKLLQLIKACCPLYSSATPLHCTSHQESVATSTWCCYCAKQKSARGRLAMLDTVM